MNYTFKQYTFKDGKTRKGKCFARSLEYFNLPYNIKSTKITTNHLINYLDHNNIEFEIKPFNQETFNTTKGFLLFYGDNFSHIANYQYGVYIDIFDNISYYNVLPKIIISINI